MAELLKYEVCAGGEHYTLHYDDGSVEHKTRTELLSIPTAKANTAIVESALATVKTEAELKTALDAIKTDKGAVK